MYILCTTCALHSSHFVNRSRPFNPCEVDGADGIDDATALEGHGVLTVDEGEGGCGVDVLAMLRWKMVVHSAVN